MYANAASLVRKNGRSNQGHPLSRMKDPKLACSKFLAMSQALPHIRMAAVGPSILQTLKQGYPISKQLRTTSTVAAIIGLDEFGGESLEEKPSPIVTELIFHDRKTHAGIFRYDLHSLFDVQIYPYFCPDTKKYLLNLYKAFSARDPVKRCAAMFGFEIHADDMLLGLKTGLRNQAGISISYTNFFQFEKSIAERSREQNQDKRMDIMAAFIDHCIPIEQGPKFVNLTKKAYDLNLAWCRKIAS